MICRIEKRRRLSRAGGFTLVEVLIAMAVGGIVMGAVMTAFLSQHRSYLAQDDVVEMQQNARMAMDMLVRDIRSAAYDPNNLGMDITTAGANNLVFTRDDNTGVLETIRYTLVDAFITEGRNDGFVDDLGRDEGAGLQPVAENISQLEFRYLDEDGNVTAALDAIRSIQVSIMVQTSRSDVNGPAAQNYTTPSDNTWTSTAGFRSRYLTTTIQCRNLGL